MADIAWTNVTIKLADLKPWQGNPKTSTGKNAKQLQASFNELGQFQTIAVGPDGEVYDGHQRLSALLAAHGNGYQLEARQSSRPLTEQERRKIAIYSRQIGAWDWDVLSGWEPDELMDWGFDGDLLNDWRRDVVALGDFLESEEHPEKGDATAAQQTLAERFIVPPFSVLDARQGYWQERKRAWLALGLQGELGRSATVSMNGGNFKNSTVSKIKSLFEKPSTFDPVLTECLYRWFCPPFGHVINPTAGESVYGIVAGVLGYSYEGVELRLEQVEANRQQAIDIGCQELATWIHGDGRNTGELVKPADFIINCPPYHDLEVYSDDPNDISTIDDYQEFMTIYAKIVKSSVGALKDNRFAAVVVGDIRDKNGNYKNFVSDTIGAFLAVGCNLYNEAILVTPLGTVMMQTSRNFPIGRKLGKTHQNVLIFVKGDSKEAVKACGEIEVHVPDGFGEYD